jgi:lipopolysaccharide heptosyltransferase I
MDSRRLPLTELAPRRIALIKPSALGDVVHALPALTALRRRFPHAHITWVVNRSFEPLLRGHPDLDETLAFDRGASRGGFWAAFGSWGRFLSRLRRGRFDLALDLQGLLRSGVMTRATGAPRRVGLAGAREGAAWLYTDIVDVPDPQSTHAVDRYLLAIRALGGSVERPTFRLPSFAAEADVIGRLLAPLPRPWIAVVVGARWLTKRWPPGHFAGLLRQAHASFGASAIFVGAAEDGPASEQAARHLDGPSLLLTGRTSLPELACVLASSNVVLANDTGPLHLAVALGRPVVAPYTCTQTRLTGPYAVAGAVEAPVPCAGSLLKQCGHMSCMNALTPERLWPALHEALTRCQYTSRSA